MKKPTQKPWYEKVIETISRKCPPENYIALSPENLKLFAVEKTPTEALRRLREMEYEGTPILHYQLD